MISYAQNFEDVVLNRVFHNVKIGSYIDVGAFDPESDSVTKHFYNKGWSGVNIEPVKRFHDKFLVERPRDINLNCVVSETDGELMFSEYGNSGLSTLREQFNPDRIINLGFEKTEYKVKSKKISTIVDELNISDVHFLKIDVEGAEKDVLMGADLKNFRPRVILVEAIKPKLPGDDPYVFEPTWPEWEWILLENGYLFGLFDGLNRYYYRTENPELGKYLQSPANFTDIFNLNARHCLFQNRVGFHNNSKLYYDISDLSGWTSNHLSGIQRVAVNLLNALVEKNMNVDIVSYNHRLDEFHSVNPEAVSPEIFMHFSYKTREVIFQNYHGKLNITHHNTADHQPSADVNKYRSISVFTKELLFRFGRSIFKYFPGIKLPILNFINLLLRVVRKFKYRNRPQRIVKGEYILSFGANWTLDDRNSKLIEAKKAGAKLYTIIYDIIPLVNYAWVNNDFKYISVFKKWTNQWLKYADVVFTISEFSKNEIALYCSKNAIVEPNIHVIRLADNLDNKDQEKIQTPNFLEGADFFIFVSTIDFRKNQVVLFETWKLLYDKLQEKCPHLLCIGSIHPGMKVLLDDVSNHPSMSRFIHFMDNVTDDELKWYYMNCKATIYPSFYEGWGLPVGESLAYGKLCLASNATSIPEIAHDLIEYYDPNDSSSICILVEHAMNDQAWLSSREKRIREEFKVTVWSETAQQVIDKIGL